MTENKDISIRDRVSGLESRLTAWLLGRVPKKGNLPPRVFNEILGTVPGTALEVVPLYVDKNGDINVFLTKRNSDDPYWPNLWHSPGTMVLNKDESDHDDFSKPWERLKKREFMRESLSAPVPVSVKFLKTKRGMETSYIHFVLVPEDLKGGKYFSVDKLPKDLVDHHTKIIREAANDLYASYLSGRLETNRKINHPTIRQNG